jgi:hypothetical protein
MADVLTLNATAKVSWTFQDALDLTTVSDNSNLNLSTDYTDGTSAGKADKIWSDKRTLAAAGNDDLDLTALTDTIFGATRTVTLVKLKGVFIYNPTSTAGDFLWLGGSVTNAHANLFGDATDKIKIGPLGKIMIESPTDGLAVDGTHKILRITNGGANTITDYRIVIWGTTA